MRRSTDRILTTHVGSLPRSDEVCALLLAREQGRPCDPAAFDETMRAAVDRVVAEQMAAGIDVVSDGETSKIGYATYIQDRLTGFGGDNPRQPAADLRDYPELRRKMALISGAQSFRRAACIGPVKVKDLSALHRDIANLKDAAARHGAAEAFMTAASPGVVTAFQPNRHYPTHEAYLGAVAEAMREEYEAIVAAGLILQLDCPDLAMSRHTGFQDLTEAEFLARAASHVEALDHALANIPADSVRMHICWGNYEGPHDHDIELAKVLPLVLKAKPAAILFEAANPRHQHEWTVWRDAEIPDDKILVPGVLDTSTNYVEHPELVAQRLVTYAGIVGRERVIAGTDCGFGTFAGVARVEPEIALKKLAAMVEGARRASRLLW